MNELNLPLQEDVTEIDAGSHQFKLISINEQNKDAVLEAVLSMCANEPCRICGELLTREDIADTVFAGYSSDNKSRSAHGDCWKSNIPQSGWAYPESTT